MPPTTMGHYLLILLLLYVPLSYSRLISGTKKRTEDTTPTEPTIKSWEEYKLYNNLTFKTSVRELRKKSAFEQNFLEIEKHNREYESGKSTFKMGTTNFVDLDQQEYMSSFVKLEPSVMEPETDGEKVQSFIVNQADIPDELDYRELGYVTEPLNQRSCGSCYAFSIAGSMEAQIFKRIRKIIPLSTQQLVDCSVTEGNHGCSGGSLRNTLRYLEHSGGIMREKDYPYANAQNKCKFEKNLAIVNITNWAVLPSKREDLLQAALVQVGPIPISINAALKSFQLYKEGVYDDPACKNDVVNHAMLLIGYTKDYWIIKNWWGAKWGEKGYMNIVRGKNACGIANFAAYALV